jgi:dolichol-phosphate mannosyltransferase
VSQRIIVVIPAYNEEGKIGRSIATIPRNLVSEILVIDDGSSDKTLQEAKGAGAKVISNKSRCGVGSVMKKGIALAKREKFDILVFFAGNSKDNGSQINLLVRPIIEEGVHFVQGSRFLPGGCYGHMPIYRLVATKYIHPFIFSFFMGKKVTDTTNGFRAIDMHVFEDKNINLEQSWLNRYELEPYLFAKVIKLGYKVKEVPVSKIYPPFRLGYTKMSPIIDWWSILKPVLLVGLKIRN